MTSRFWLKSAIFASRKFQRCVKPLYPSCKWISPFLSFMHTNLGCPSTRTTLELVMRNSTEHCCRPQVSLRKIMNKNNKISVLIKVFFNDISNIVFVEKQTRKRLFIEVSWLEFHKYGITQIPRKE